MIWSYLELILHNYTIDNRLVIELLKSGWGRPVTHLRISARGKLFLATEDVEAALVEWALKTDESIPTAWMTSHNHLARLQPPISLWGC